MHDLSNSPFLDKSGGLKPGNVKKDRKRVEMISVDEDNSAIGYSTLLFSLSSIICW